MTSRVICADSITSVVTAPGLYYTMVVGTAGIYQSGHLSPREEVGTIYFQQLVRRALEKHL